jgi:hypothetical protein
MSKVLDQWPSGDRSSYHWERYADGRIHQLTEGEDYRGGRHPRNAVTSAHVWAKRNGFTVRTVKTPDGVIVQFTPLT